MIDYYSHLKVECSWTVIKCNCSVLYYLIFFLFLSYHSFHELISHLSYDYFTLYNKQHQTSPYRC